MNHLVAFGFTFFCFVLFLLLRSDSAIQGNRLICSYSVTPDFFTSGSPALSFLYVNFYQHLISLLGLVLYYTPAECVCKFAPPLFNSQFNQWFKQYSAAEHVLLYCILVLFSDQYILFNFVTCTCDLLATICPLQHRSTKLWSWNDSHNVKWICWEPLSSFSALLFFD